jgi:hypothetical protein
MTMQRPNATPKIPTPPTGVEIARYPTYLEAQKAVDFLSDKQFAVQDVTIVGEGLRAVERITGRLTYARVAVAGLASGAWFGLFVGLLLTLFGAAPGGTLIAAIAIGAAFGVLFGIISYALTGNQRDFTSQSQIVASSYAILCAPESAGQARQVLSALGLGEPVPPVPGRTGGGAPTPSRPTVPGQGAPRQGAPGQEGAPGQTGPQQGSWAMPPAGQAPPTPAPAPAGKPAAPVPARFRTATGEPRYGRRLEDADKAPAPDEPAAPSAPAEPAQPASPTSPPAPVAPPQPTQPTTPEEPAAPADPADPPERQQ